MAKFSHIAAYRFLAPLRRHSLGRAQICCLLACATRRAKVNVLRLLPSSPLRVTRYCPSNNVNVSRWKCGSKHNLRYAPSKCLQAMRSRSAGAVQVRGQGWPRRAIKRSGVTDVVGRGAKDAMDTQLDGAIWASERHGRCEKGGRVTAPTVARHILHGRERS